MENSVIADYIHPLQYGFQKGKSSKMVSFILQECVNYCVERDSCLYACFMDAEKAFDCVWINGLLYKLSNIGVSNKDVRLLGNYYTNMRSRVMANNLLSQWIPIEQGTRQDSLLSPLLYSVHINDLIIRLCESRVGLKIGDRYFTAPTKADDLLLLCTTSNGLLTLLRICWQYSCLWRMIYNALKCVIMIYNERRRIETSIRSWKFGDTAIHEVRQHKHLGVIQSNTMTKPVEISSVVQSLRGTFLSFTSCGLHPNGLNPISGMKLYISAVLPKALYACELLNDISITNLSKLEIAHRFCVKYSQGLPKLTRTDIALGLVGISSIEAYIDLQKLYFLGTLCNADSNFIVKYLFLLRLFQYKLCGTKVQKGFVKDLYRILQKYSLLNNINEFYSSGIFPSKYSWKRICKTAVWQFEELSWKNRLNQNDDFRRFRSIQSELKPSILWQIPVKKTGSLELCSFVVKLSSLTENEVLCPRCGGITRDILKHLFSDCVDNTTRLKLKTFWENVYSMFGDIIHNILTNLELEDFITLILGKLIPIAINVLTEDKYCDFIILSSKLLWALFV